MTESEWLTCGAPDPMLGFLRGKASERRLRLFVVACCRRSRSLLRSRVTRAVMEALEAYADHLMTRGELEELRTAWYGRFDYPFPISGTWNSAFAHATTTNGKIRAAETANDAAVASNNRERERVVQSRFLRDIFGNPFRPVTINPAWLTSTVVQLAQGIYDERAFDRMPILADALQDAGCDNDDILNHCRDEKATHVRGCWVVDLILGKS